MCIDSPNPPNPVPPWAQRGRRKEDTGFAEIARRYESPSVIFYQPRLITAACVYSEVRAHKLPIDPPNSEDYPRWLDDISCDRKDWEEFVDVVGTLGGIKRERPTFNRSSTP